MPNYHKLYLKLFGVQADAIDKLKETMELLIRAHQEAEEAIMNASDFKVIPLDTGNELDE